MRMRLGEFIAANIESILVEWESFARSIWPADTPGGPVELRNSAEQILHAIVADMATPQNPREQSLKSAGRGTDGPESNRLNHTSQVHGAGRVGSGVGLPAVVAEYRALRASVLRLWRTSNPAPDLHDLEDLTRFNEAVDQSLTQAVSSFVRRIEATRNMFLAILGHDLRNPLAAITLTAKLAMIKRSDPSELPQQLAQIMTSANAIAELITTLIDFAGCTMGVGLPLAPAPADLHVLCHEVLREMRATHAARSISLDVRGNLAGTWDGNRLRQLLVNLLSNALQHSSPGSRVQLAVDGTAPDTVVITVHNTGEPIPADVLPTIFDPLVRAPASVQQRRTPGSIGLGLYIVREIATAHGGTAELTSTAVAGTTATIRLPRHARKKGHPLAAAAHD
jgi:signal transduction histidine kinase